MRMQVVYILRMTKHPDKHLDTWSMLSLLTSWWSLGMGLGKVALTDYDFKTHNSQTPQLRRGNANNNASGRDTQRHASVLQQAEAKGQRT